MPPLRDSPRTPCVIAGLHGVTEGQPHPGGIMGPRHRSRQQDGVTTELHRKSRVRSSADPCVEHDRYARAHGGAKTAAFHGRNLVQYQQLEAWVYRLAGQPEAQTAENEAAARAAAQALALMKQADLAGTWRVMAASLAEDFAGDLVRMVAFAPVEGVEDVDWLQVIAGDDPRLAGFRDILGNGEPLCGRLHPDKNALLYGVRADEVQSSALLALPGTGLVAIGSRDPNRFFPGMGTLFLRMMGEAFAAALQRFA